MQKRRNDVPGVRFDAGIFMHRTMTAATPAL